jgi:hypothetical protein
MDRPKCSMSSMLGDVSEPGNRETPWICTRGVSLMSRTVRNRRGPLVASGRERLTTMHYVSEIAGARSSRTLRSAGRANTGSPHGTGRTSRLRGSALSRSATKFCRRQADGCRGDSRCRPRCCIRTSTSTRRELVVGTLKSTCTESCDSSATTCRRSRSCWRAAAGS